MKPEDYTGRPDVRLLRLPGSPPYYDPVAKTLYGLPVKVKDLDVACFEPYETRLLIVSAMASVESCDDEVDGFVQLERQFMVCGKGDSHTQIFKICHECKWLSKAHRPGCLWALVSEVHSF